MSIKLSSTNVSPYNYYSEGDGSNPISASVTLDGTGGTVDTNVVTTYLVATTFNYTGITVQPVTEETGINWQVSLDGGTTWAESVSPADMDATAGDQTVAVSIKAVVANDGTVSTGTYVAADVQITATENP